jgi:hypothetical protein
MKQLVDWTDTPLGNLITNGALEVAGILLTVFLVQRWVDKREVRRWLPLKHQMYASLLNTTDTLVLKLSPHQPSERHKLAYYFGDSHGISSFTEEFGEELLSMGSESFDDQTSRVITEAPNLVQEAYQEFRDNRESAPFLLFREPEFSSLMANLDLAFRMALDELKASNLRFVAQSAYWLHKWLCTQATADEPVSDVVRRFNDNTVSRPGGEDGE